MNEEELNQFEVDPEGSATLAQSLEEKEEAAQYRLASQAQVDQLTQNREDFKLKEDDPRLKEEWGVGGLAKEAQSILSGGLRDTYE